MATVNISPERRKEAVAKRLATQRRNKELRLMEEQRKRDSADKLLQLINERKRILEELSAHVTFGEMAGKLANTTLLREEEIVAKAQKWEGCAGVYFLVHRGEVVYVGQSVNVFSRLHQHNIRDFDSFAYVPCDKKHLDVLESLYIHCLRPPMNKVVDGRVVAPLSMDKLLGGRC